ncbi:ribose 5-phosphate isomerase B [Roseisolibacter agri]|uniref:Ribose 5-phosphate isomerase B n=1 Tax=Roseisolibacter agri TaxID=2014610 RepID=A0AA37VF77_9BACT|nr:ribose 5-phosphate isomerase B [Roseisolibacter agri]GLC26414.1 ribose 5-phosphate isomerase B [Roseisolibacter agri]
MKESIPIAADHAGFELKEKLRAALERRGFAVDDLGPSSDASTDYADYAHPLADRVSTGQAARGILMCGTGLGMSYAANRHPHVRAAVAWAPEIAELARRHNDANVLVLPARFLSEEEAEQILDAWLATPFDGGRHERRIEKIETTDAARAEEAARHHPDHRVGLGEQGPGGHAHEELE